MPTVFAHAMDVRSIAPRDRHPLIFGRFDALQPGESLLLVNDHDPRPLYEQFADRRTGQFDWTPLQSGPDLWRVQIAKTAPATTVGAYAGSCCSGGACGG